MGIFGQGPGFTGKWPDAHGIHKREEAFPSFSSGLHHSFQPQMAHRGLGFGRNSLPPSHLPIPSYPPCSCREALPHGNLLVFLSLLLSISLLLLWPLGPEKPSASFISPNPLLLAPGQVARLSIIHSVPPGSRWDSLGGTRSVLHVPQAEHLVDSLCLTLLQLTASLCSYDSDYVDY